MNVPQEHLRKTINVPLEILTTVEVCDLKMSQKVASQVLKGNFWNYYDTFFMYQCTLLYPTLLVDTLSNT